MLSRQPHSRFLSTLSLRRATKRGTAKSKGSRISIHALLAESDLQSTHSCDLSIPFLSTLSLRRATRVPGPAGQHGFDFYPRSPCGERLGAPVDRMPSSSISIHALLAESDYLGAGKSCNVCYFYPRSPCGERLPRRGMSACHRDFYPRSPCGERQLRMVRGQNAERISIHALLAESDRSRP